MKKFFIYLFNLSLSNKEIVFIKDEVIKNNFMFNEDKTISSENFNYNSYNTLSIQLIGALILYVLIVYPILNSNSKENSHRKKQRNTYVGKNEKSNEDISFITSDFLVVYERAYYYYVIYILVTYYLIKNYLNKNLNLKPVHIILIMLFWNLLIIYHMKNQYTNFLTNNFTSTFDGKLVIFTILYTNIMIIIELLLNNKPYKPGKKTKNNYNEISY
jgi:hypothetical protein